MARHSSPRLSIMLSTLALLAPTHASTKPQPAKWSGSTFGADGPWNTVEVIVGNGQKVNLFPGHEWESYLITTDYCSLNVSSTSCSAGAYNQAESLSSGTGSGGGIEFQQLASVFMAGMDVEGGTTEMWLDTVDIQSGGAVPNTSLSLLTQQMSAYPGGTWYPFSAGCLAVGSVGDLGTGAINQSFSRGPDTPPINGSLIPGYFWENGVTASNSYAMHIGAAYPRLGGSLLFGGYDQNRVVGPVMMTDYPGTFSLKDISIQVVKGGSPFDFTTQAGLLAAGDGSLATGLPVTVDGCSPYLTLPKSVCDSIASHLPTTYNSALGLYTWNTNDPLYQKIVTSPSVLSFTFISDSNTQNTTINVPFSHLNLTLSLPLADRPTPYFPCFTGGQPHTYVLGRAFLQDAFYGAHWNQQKIFLAQAPGPNIPLSSSVVELTQDAAVVSAGKNDWEASWDGVWTALPTQSGPARTLSASPGPTSSSSSTNPATSSSLSSITTPARPGLSTAAMAGIAAGAAVAGLVLVGALVLFWRRRRAAESAVISPASATEQLSPYQHFKYDDSPSGGPYHEMAQPRPAIQELVQPDVKHEMEQPYHLRHTHHSAYELP